MIQREYAKTSRRVGFSLAVSICASVKTVLSPPAGGSHDRALVISASKPFQKITVAFWLGAISHCRRTFCVTATPNRLINSSVVAVLVQRPHMINPFVDEALLSEALLI